MSGPDWCGVCGKPINEDGTCSCPMGNELERLRALVQEATNGQQAAMKEAARAEGRLAEAQDSAQRLRAENERLRALVADQESQILADRALAARAVEQRDEARAEVERLREAYDRLEERNRYLEQLVQDLTDEGTER